MKKVISILIIAIMLITGLFVLTGWKLLRTKYVVKIKYWKYNKQELL